MYFWLLILLPRTFFKPQYLGCLPLTQQNDVSLNSVHSHEIPEPKEHFLDIFLVVVGKTLWRICPTTVSLLLKSEPIEINEKINFLIEVIVVWKFLKASRASGSDSVKDGLRIKNYEDWLVTKNGFFPVEDRAFMLWINENIF